ncbi:MAG TPA: 50S ribosomal protein L25, partial [Actinomycetota bacterium]
ADGRVPGILYGGGQDPIPIHVSGQDLLHLFHQAGGNSVLVDLEVDGKKHLAIAREIQRDHLRGRYVHVDFMEVRADETFTLSVEIHEIGEAAGLKLGGVLEHHLREVEIECLPTNVPEGMVIDLSGMEIGDIRRVGDLIPVEGVTVLTDPEISVVSVITPAALRTEADLLLPGEEGVEAEGEAEGEAEPGEAPTEAEAPAEEGGEG